MFNLQLVLMTFSMTVRVLYWENAFFYKINVFIPTLHKFTLHNRIYSQFHQ